ncbi:hypothetical protein CSA80_03720 [Candidatus Saccharibacteria bacterium]|nr:MAG: hypothetical protein CR973_01210 [Candidatus Saccharibacteria bacterium]PID99194.1 MAG: hypothetical protein CSA80_03720 [Candidatus Saccharibacteria bacterium]
MKYWSSFSLLLASVILGAAFFMAVPQAAAEDPLDKACTGVTDSATCGSRTKKNPITGQDGMLYRVSTIVAVIAGIAAVFVIVVSGFRYITSGGDSQKTAAAKNTLIGAIAGLVIIVLAQAIITFVLRRL